MPAWVSQTCITHSTLSDWQWMDESLRRLTKRRWYVLCMYVCLYLCIVSLYGYMYLCVCVCAHRHGWMERRQTTLDQSTGTGDSRVCADIWLVDYRFGFVLCVIVLHGIASWSQIIWLVQYLIESSLHSNHDWSSIDWVALYCIALHCIVLLQCNLIGWPLLILH
jgi:hypothetical protein